MKFTLEYPSDVADATPDLLRSQAVRSLSRLAEDVGFSAVALSEHPAPSRRWRDSGGHDTLDPAVALGFIAAATTDIRIMTNLYVIPYRNPYLTAKSLTSLDLLSEGRLIAGVGAGYLRSEFAALGVDFNDRAALFDDYLRALTEIWQNPERAVQGSGFQAPGPVSLLRPHQVPAPPIWIGGNSRAALRRVVEYGHGWCPMVAPESVASSVRTPVITGPKSLGAAVTDLRTRLVEVGRDPQGVDIQVNLPWTDLTDHAAVDSLRRSLADYESVGVTHATVRVEASSINAATRYIDRFSHLILNREL